MFWILDFFKICILGVNLNILGLILDILANFRGIFIFFSTFSDFLKLFIFSKFAFWRFWTFLGYFGHFGKYSGQFLCFFRFTDFWFFFQNLHFWSIWTFFGSFCPFWQNFRYVLLDFQTFLKFRFLKIFISGVNLNILGGILRAFWWIFESSFYFFRFS